MDARQPPPAWTDLSPQLDELLTLPPLERARSLARIAANDTARGAQLALLIEQRDAASRDGFLGGVAEPRWAAPTLAAGDRFGAWSLVDPLGEGGMGSVWRAGRSDGRFDGEAAVKVLRSGLFDNAARERFRREGAYLARLTHPAIARLFDAGITERGLPYLVLELVPGERVDRHCDARRLDVGARIGLVLQVLDAVAAAHAQLVLHRDLKPSNILVQADSRARLLDFGIAQLLPGAGEPLGMLTREGAFVLTPQYAAPEQASEAPLSTATDVYALGVVLYELLCGVHPSGLAGPDAGTLAYLRAAAEGEFTRPSLRAVQVLPGAEAPAARAAARATTPQGLQRRLRGDLDHILARALEPRVAERYATATAFADDLRRHLRDEPVQARAAPWSYRLVKFVRRHRGGVAAGAALAAALLAGGAGTAWQAVQAGRERDEARLQAERALARGNLFNLLLGETGALDAPLTQRQLLERAVNLVERSFGSQHRLAAELMLPIAGQYHTLGDIRADLAVMERAAAHAQASGDDATVASVACSTVNTYLALGRDADAEAALARGKAALARVSAPPQGVQTACLRFEAEWAHRAGHASQARAATEAATKLLEDRGSTRGNAYTSMLSLLTNVRNDDGDTVGAFAADDRLRVLLVQTGRGDSLEARLGPSARAALLLDAGEVGAAHDALVALVAHWDGGTEMPPRVLTSLALAQLRRAEWAAAEQTLERAEREGRQLGGGEVDLRILVLRAHTALGAGHPAQARQRLAVALAAPGPSFRLRGVTLTIGTLQAQLALAEGDAAGARRLIDAEVVRLDTAAIRRLETRAATLRAAARIALANADPAAAARHAQAALDAATRGARDPRGSANVGEAQLLLALARHAQGDAAGARELGARAAASLERGMGVATPLLDEARAVAAR